MSIGMNKDEINAASELAKEVIKPVYEDAIKPAALEVGQSLRTISGMINVALTPVAVMVHGFKIIEENLKTRLENKLSNVKSENIVEPPLSVVGPLIDKYKYAYDNQYLSEMFVNLLACAMNKDKIQNAHPSFVNIISELSSDEAKLIKTISKESFLPKIDLKLELDSGNGYIIIYSDFTLLGEIASLDNADLTPSYLNNLRRLGIINYSDTMSETYTKESVYEELINHQNIKRLIETYPKDSKITTQKGIIKITNFGRMFISAVIRD
ncbi:MAG: DUF4393 domain-containing protein [Candidatus Moraniibacteriota bacterium]